MNKIAHAAERKAFQTILNRFINQGANDDISEMTESLLSLIRKVMGDAWRDETFKTLQAIGDDPDNKWHRYVDRILKNTDKGILSTFLLNAAYEGGFRGNRTSEEYSIKYKCNVPWVILMDPTTACNYHCTGCWAAEYGDKHNLSFEDMDRVLTEGKELGVHACLFTGGEPLIRKKDLIRLCEKHKDIAFHAFTNGSLIDDDFCKDLLRVRNFFLSVSIEGYADTNDARRGAGHFDKVMQAMDLMHSYRIPFGVSICYTSLNYKTVTSDEFIDMIVDKGASFAWYFHYMPVGMNASTELLLSPEQRLYVKDRIRWIRGANTGKELFAIDFQNDGEFIHGCVAGGKRYLHINAAGDVEPCVFIHYSDSNIHDKSLLECLQSPLFLEYYNNMPFNKNHLRPCPMLENPQWIKEMVNRSGAKSTDLEAPESVEHLSAKTRGYADAWASVADKIWYETYPGGEYPHKERVREKNTKIDHI